MISIYLNISDYTSSKCKWSTKTILTILSLLILLPCFSSVRLEKNWMRIMERFVSLCGVDFLCDKDQFETITSIETSNVSLNCPVCSCDSLCRLNGNCCPDVSLNTCVRTSFDVSRARNPKMLYMTNDCPHNTDEVMVKKCQDANIDTNVMDYFIHILNVTTTLQQFIPQLPYSS